MREQLGKNLLASTALLLAVAGPVAAAEPGNLFVVVSPLFESGPSGVVGIRIDPEGVLSQGETYATGGTGRAFTSPQLPAVDPGGNHLFVPNNESVDISVFTIQAEGGLSPVAGSPFPTGGAPSDLAVHPTGDWLYATNFTIGAVSVHQISTTGSLKVEQTVPAGFPQKIEIHPSGEYLYVADLFSGIRGFAIAADGSLSELAASPFTFASSRPSDVEIDTAGALLFALDLDAGIAVFKIDATGELTPRVDPPTFVSGFTAAFTLTDDDAFIYASESSVDLVHGLRVRGNARPRQVNRSPFPGDFTIIQMLNPAGTNTLYTIGRDTRRIGVLQTAPNGRLTPPSFFSVADEEERVPNGAEFLADSAARRSATLPGSG